MIFLINSLEKGLINLMQKSFNFNILSPQFNSDQ